MTVLAAEGMVVCDHPWLGSVQRITRIIEPGLVTGAGDRELLHLVDTDDDRLARHAHLLGRQVAA